MTVVPYDALLKRMRAEFMEMPGLRLPPRAGTQRLCGVERTVCQPVLDMLVHTKFLCVKANGAYARVTDGTHTPRPHPAKADLRVGIRNVKALG